MTTDTILAAAQAAYAAYFPNRLARTWETECFPVQGRWIRVAALVLNGSIKRAPDLRFRYFEGYAGVRPWEDVSRIEQQRWDCALYAITRAALLARDAA